MKILLLILTFLFFEQRIIYAATDGCDSIENKTKKIDCYLDLKKKGFKNKTKKEIKKINKILNSVNAKKKKFDEENKTLFKMFKNLNKNENK
jgi:septal ring factor EnvC (AmiA/AmiB activator)|tara:strand:- start:937 stop:1212 length:276 start_codon:yes stop_codon:yes gene_type:complete